MKKLSPEIAARAVNKLALMAFFPSDMDIRAALVEVFLDMVENDEQMEWLAKRTLQLYGKWPGIGELRAVYCSKFKPKDGFEAYSIVYPEGIPSERPRPVMRDAARGEPVSADAEVDRMITQAAARKKLGKAVKP